jgi:hypothetical protein
VFSPSLSFPFFPLLSPFFPLSFFQQVVFAIIVMCTQLGKAPNRIYHMEGINTYMNKYDRLCGLAVRVLDYRSGGPGSIPGTNRKKIK